MRITLSRVAAIGALALFGVGALSSNASAYTVDFDTNWKTGGGTQINGKPSATWTSADGSGVTVTLTAAPKGTAKLTLDPSDGGIGIDSRSYEDDEIEGCESLTITFSAPVTLSEVYLVDLFKEPNNYGTGAYLERGYYQVDGKGALVAFTADPSQTSGTAGLKILEINQVVTSIVLTAPGYTGSWNKQDHDFAAAGFTFTTGSSSVPELDSRSAFGAIGLLFAGLMVGTSRRRRLHLRPGV